MKKFFKKTQVLAVLVVLTGSIILTGCAAPQGMSNSKRYALNGGIVGAGVGAVLGNNIKGLNTLEGAVAGSVIGAVTGAVTGNNRDRSEQLYYQQQQQQRQMRGNSGGRPSHEEAHRQGIPHKCPNGTMWNGNQTSNQKPRTTKIRESEWVRNSDGDYGLKPVINTTNIYGDVNVGRRYPPHPRQRGGYDYRMY